MPLNSLLDSGMRIEPPPDVQRTTLGLDALARFATNTFDEATANGGAPFDAIVIGAGMFGGYCAEKIFRFGEARGLRVLVLDAGPFVLPTHLQNLPRTGLNVPGPLSPAADSGTARELIWGLPWRSNVDWIGQAYCIGGKSLYWGGWCPRLLAADLAAWPPTVAQYLATHYQTLERQTGVDETTDFIQGPLYDLLKHNVSSLIARNAVAHLDAEEDPPLAVQGQAPASGLFSFDKFSSVSLLLDAAREAAAQPTRSADCSSCPIRTSRASRRRPVPSRASWFLLRPANAHSRSDRRHPSSSRSARSSPRASRCSPFRAPVSLHRS
jgi:hypothetical protein